MAESQNLVSNINSTKINNYSLNEIKSENKELKKEIEKLKLSNMHLSVEKEDLKKIINLLKNKEKECIMLQAVINEKDEKIEYFQNMVLMERKIHQEDLRKNEENFENELLHIKRDQDTVKHKIDNFNKMNHLNDILYSKVLELENNIEELKKEEIIKLNNKELEYNNKVDKYKKRLIDFLKRGDRQREEDDQRALNNQLNILHIQELIEEIEYTNVEVNNLLKEKKMLKTKIMNLSSDLNIYKIMVLTLAQKNEEYQKKLKSLNNPIKNNLNHKNDGEKVISFAENNNENFNKDLLNKRLRLLTPSIRKKNMLLDFYLNTNNKKKEKNTNINNYTINNNISSIKLRLESSNSINKKIGQKLMIKYKKEKEKYKDMYEFYKSKYNYITKKFKNIIDMYSEELEKIYKEEKINLNSNDISININDFKDFKFEQMASNQKYSILIKLINHIAPLVCKKDFQENSFIDNVFKVKEKYNLYNIKKNNSIFSNSQKSFEKTKKIKSKEDSVANFPERCTISTYFSPNSKKIVNGLYSNTFRFSKIKGHNFILHNLKIPTFIESKNNVLDNSPFKYH